MEGIRKALREQFEHKILIIGTDHETSIEDMGEENFVAIMTNLAKSNKELYKKITDSINE